MPQILFWTFGLMGLAMLLLAYLAGVYLKTVTYQAQAVYHTLTAVTAAATTYEERNETERLTHAWWTMFNSARTFVLAAEGLHEEDQYAEKRAYVMRRLQEQAEQLHVEFSVDQLEALLEGAVLETKLDIASRNSSDGYLG